MDSPSTAPLRVTSTSDLTEIAVPASPTSTDGWGELENGIEEHENDKDGWDDLEPLEEPKPSPALASIQAAQKRPVSQPVSQAKHGILYFLWVGIAMAQIDVLCFHMSDSIYILEVMRDQKKKY